MNSLYGTRRRSSGPVHATCRVGPPPHMFLAPVRWCNKSSEISRIYLYEDVCAAAAAAAWPVRRTHFLNGIHWRPWRCRRAGLFFNGKPASEQTKLAGSVRAFRPSLPSIQHVPYANAAVREMRREREELKRQPGTASTCKLLLPIVLRSDI